MQDLGGVKFLTPIINRLDQENIEIFIHPISKDFFSKNSSLDFYDYEVSSESARSFWRRKVKGYSHLITTTSSLHLDMSNATLIETAKEEGIACLSFLDHWKGFDRFFNEENQPNYLSDWLGVIDDESIQRLSSNGIKPKHIKSVGHPWIDQLLALKGDIKNKQSEKALIISQPDPSSNFDSIFLREETLNSLMKLIEFLSRKGWSISYRAHPKERNPLDIDIDLDNSDSIDVFEKYDLFIGYDSMMLLEASSFGKIVLSCYGDINENISDQMIPFKYSKSFDEFMIRYDEAAMDADIAKNYNRFRGSTERAMIFVKEFLNS